jgi:hypothetical protein
MSILRFLRVIEEEIGAPVTRGRPRNSRPLALETLEGRAVLTLIGELPLPTLPELFPPLAPTTESPSTSPEPTSEEAPPPTEPVDTAPVTEDPPPTETEPGGLPAEPIDEERDFSRPPEITVSAERNGEWVCISGVVTDDKPVEGLVVFCLTDSGFSFTMVVGADGTYQSSSYPLEWGVMISVWTIDLDGIGSNAAICSA